MRGITAPMSKTYFPIGAGRRSAPPRAIGWIGSAYVTPHSAHHFDNHRQKPDGCIQPIHNRPAQRIGSGEMAKGEQSRVHQAALPLPDICAASYAVSISINVTRPPVAWVMANRSVGFGKVSPAAARVIVDRETPTSAASFEADSPSRSRNSFSVIDGLLA